MRPRLMESVRGARTPCMEILPLHRFPQCCVRTVTTARWTSVGIHVFLGRGFVVMPLLGAYRLRTVVDVWKLCEYSLPFVEEWQNHGSVALKVRTLVDLTRHFRSVKGQLIKGNFAESPFARLLKQHELQVNPIKVGSRGGVSIWSRHVPRVSVTFWVNEQSARLHCLPSQLNERTFQFVEYLLWLALVSPSDPPIQDDLQWLASRPPSEARLVQCEILATRAPGYSSRGAMEDDEESSIEGYTTPCPEYECDPSIIEVALPDPLLDDTQDPTFNFML